jgi:glycosyltransferase involved in cell wall biosynthesis
LKNRKIFFDITTSYYWQGEDVGIIRTEKALAKILLCNIPKHVIFCLFSKKNKNFTILSHDNVAELIESKNAHKVNQDIIKNAPPPIEDIILNIISKKIFKNISKKVIPTYYHSACKNFYGELKHFIYSIKCIRGEIFSKKINKKQTQISNLIFSHNDVYISLGLDWDKENLKELYKIVKDIGIKTVLFCYDLIPYKFPQFCAPEYSVKISHYFNELLWCANYVICISENSKKDLIEYAKTTSGPLPNLKVINIGCDLLKTTTKKIEFNEKSLINNKDFILTVSTIEPRKNHIILYNVWKKLYEYDSKNCPLLVIVGRNGWLYNDLQAIIKQDCYINKHIIVINNTNDFVLEWLYTNCLFTVFPSFYEGWGMPVAESLYYGKYCISSNTSSFPEVSQNLIKMLDPLDFYSWYNAIKDLLENRSKLKLLENNIKKNYEPITLNSMAINFLNFIKTEFNVGKN